MEYIMASKKNIDECVRMRMLYILNDDPTLSDSDKLSFEKTLYDYFNRKLNKEIYAFLAKEDKRIVGMALLLMIEKPANPSMKNGITAEVLSVIVDEEYRHKGIATNLINNLINVAKEKDVCRIVLRATAMGKPLYLKLGFKEHPFKCEEMAYIIK